MKRYGMIIKVKPEKFEEYKKLHAPVWSEVLDSLKKHNIQNYSIYHKDGYLFSYFEYTGKDFEADMARHLASESSQKFNKLCMPCQEPLNTRADGEWWANMKAIFHFD